MFEKEFKTLSYIIKNSRNILLFAHSSPDGDTTGANLALYEYLKSIGKNVDIACLDPFPSYLEKLTSVRFEFPAHLHLDTYDAAIGSDSVERGFGLIKNGLPENTVTVIIDHHPDITVPADVVIIDHKKSSTCEIIFDFFENQRLEITTNIATYLLLGILSDTGNFQHSNTSTRVMEIASILMKKGASSSKIIDATFTNKKLSTLKLWGKAFEKAKINNASGMIVTALTKKDIEECGATGEDMGQVASILNTVPGTKFSLVLSERDNGFVKGSLRSEEYKNTDVSKIAHEFGGGGHRLASGFEVKGRIVEKPNGWQIV